MDASDCHGFKLEGFFSETAEAWRMFSGPATYLLVCDRAITRLYGASDILYIGKTKNLGGSDRSRLWSYKYPNNHELSIRKCVEKLTADGTSVSFLRCQVPPEGLTVKQYESQLLARYEADHWELPPLNFSR
jgi:hypothetical protein